MRRLFSFRSSASRNGSINPTPPAPEAPDDAKVYWEPPAWGNNVRNLMGEKVQDGSQAPKDLVGRPAKCYLEENLADRRLGRSLSFSSASIYNGSTEGNSNHNPCNSPSSLRSSRCHAPECLTNCRSPTPERYTRTKGGNQSSVQQLAAVGILNSPCPSTECQCSSGNSPYSSPIQLRCRTARLTENLNKNKTLDLYMDVVEYDKDPQNHLSHIGNDGCLAENKVLSCTRRPPRAPSTTPSSPTYSKVNVRTYSLGEVKDIPRHLSPQDWIRDDIWPTSPRRHTRRNDQKLSHAFTGETMTRSRDSDSETIIKTEDICEEHTFKSEGIGQKPSIDSISPYDDINGYSAEELLGFQKQSFVLENGTMGMKTNNLRSSIHSTDEELNEKEKEVDQMLIALSEEAIELEDLKNNSLNESALRQMITDISEARTYLAQELCLQIKCRIAERSSAKGRLKKVQLELDHQTKRLEKEKNELQSSLEKELDRRSSIWSLKLEKFQFEEQRLRERVRELAEKNVSLQREISVLKGNEVDGRNKIMNVETQLSSLTANLKESRTENNGLHQAYSELQELFKGAEEERDFIEISYKGKEKENKELQKVVARLQRICCEQEKTINGLRLGYNNEISKQSTEKDDDLSRLQMEQLRLTSVEQVLRKEIESSMNEIGSLRHENMCILGRLQGTGDGHGFSSCKLDKELCDRVDCLQTQGLSLLNDGFLFCGELLSFMKYKQDEDGQEANNKFAGFSVAEYTVKYQNLRRNAEDYRRSLQKTLSVVDEKNRLQTLECGSHNSEDLSRPLKIQASEDAEFELKAETLLTKVLREKLCSKELELDQLREDLSYSVRAHDVLQTESQRLQDEISCLTHKTKGMELQMHTKDECINQLQYDLQNCTKDLTATRNILTKVSEERDHMWEQVKHSSETIMLLNHEVSSLKKMVEALNEDVLIKEGQIAILKDSLGDKPFDIICSPNSMKEFSVEY